MTRVTRHCEKCGASSADRIVDVYNDFGDNPGNLICDPCVLGAMDRADRRTEYVMPVRPEGYYHCAPGTFD